MASLVSTTVNGDLKVTGSSNLFFEGSASSNTFEPGTRIYGAGITLTGGAYTSVFEYTVPGGLAGNFRFFVKGTTGNVVIPTQVDVLLNHSKDITIKSQTGNYTPLHVKVLTNNNEDCLVQLKADTSGNANVTVYIDVIAFGDGSVSFSSFGSYTGTSLEHKCNFGFAFSTANNLTLANFVMDGSNSGGRLGIGTNNPINNLHVFNGNIDTRGSNLGNSTVQLYFDPTNGNSAGDSNILGSGITWKVNYGGYSKRSAGIVQIGEGNYFRSALAFYTNSTADHSTDWSERMRISMEGNVGIGSTNPAKNLDVTGDFRATSLITAGNHIFMSKSSDPRIYAGTGVGLNIDGEALYLNRYASSDVAMVQGGGSVGIGTATPGQRLDIINGSVRISQSGEVKIFFRETIAADTYADRWTIGNDDAINNAFVFSTGANFASPKLVILDGGGVGIGTNDPGTAKLYVRGGSSSQTFVTGADELVVEGSDHSGISILAPAAKRAQLYFNSDAFLRWVDNDGIFSIDTSASASKIVIAPSGAGVGIGTVPQARFEVDLNQTSGTLAADNYAHFGGQHHTNGSVMGITLGYREANLLYRKVGIVARGLGDNSARQDLAFLVSTVNSSVSVKPSDAKLTISGLTGYVGIGTTNPGAQLDLHAGNMLIGDSYLDHHSTNDNYGLQIKSIDTNQVALELRSNGGSNATGTWRTTLYATAQYYGFLDSAWGNWDIKKNVNGALQIDQGSGLETVLTTATGMSSSTAWANMGAGTRTNYTLKFQPPASSYAGFQFNGTDGNSAGYFLIRGTSDDQVYTAEGITLVADQGWLTLAQRTATSKGVRIMTGSGSGANCRVRINVSTDGDIVLGVPTNSLGTATTTTLKGYSVQYDSGGAGARLSNQGFLIWNTGGSWTGNERMWAFTNASNMGGGGGPRFALLRGNASNVVPTLGDIGSLGTNTLLTCFWSKDGDFYNSGNIGIGAESPVGDLMISRGSSAGAEIQFHGTDTAYHRLGIRKTGSRLDMGEYNNDGDTLTPILTVDGDGDRVGIGTTDPGFKLHVAGGDVRLTTYSNSVYFGSTRLLGYDSSTAGNLWIIGGSGGASGSCRVTLGTGWNWDTSCDFHYAPGTYGAGTGVLSIGQQSKNNANYTHGITRFYTKGAERVRINADGELLVGLVSDLNTGSKIHVNSAIALGSSTYTYSQVVGGADLQLISNGNPANLGTNSNIIFKLGTSGGGGPNEAMRIVSTGNVGIGTDDPDSLLMVYKSGADSIIHVRGAASGGDARVRLNGYESSELYLDRNGSGRFALRRTTGTDDLSLLALNSNYTDNSTIMFWDYSHGCVGIGTTIPAQKLEVSGNIIVNNQILTPSGSNLALNPNTGLVTVGGSLTVVGNATFGSAATKLRTYSDSNYSGIYNGSSLQTDEAVYFGSGSIYFYANATSMLRITSGAVFPTANGTKDLGLSGNRWNNVYSEAGNFSGNLTGVTANFSGAIVAGAASTNGGVWLEKNYGTPHKLNVLSSHYSNGNTLIGYGAAGKSGGSGYVATYGNFSGKKSIIELSASTLYFKVTDSAAQDTVGDDITLNQRLAVNKDSMTFTSSGGAGLVVERTSNSAYLQFYPAYSSVPTIMGKGAGGLHLGYNSNTSGIRIDTSNNVIIKDNILFFGSTSGPFVSNDSTVLRLAGDGGVKIQTYVSGWQDRLTIIDNGNVGIGTTNPEHRLDVHGGGGGTFGAITNRQSANTNTDGIATVNYNAGNSSLRLWVDGSGNRKINAGNTEIISFTASAVSITKSTTITGTATATTFSGSGASLTSLNASNIGSGTINVARLGSGATSSKFLRGDNTWQTVTSGGGTITGVTVGTGLDGGGTSGSVSINLDLSEFTDMTSDITTSDEVILLDSGAERRKAFGELKLSKFNNDSGWTSNSGTMSGWYWGVDSSTATYISNSETVRIKGGTNVTVSRSGNDVTINASGGGGSGTVTSVATSTGLQGGTITTSGTLSVTGAVCMSINAPSGSAAPSGRAFDFLQSGGITISASGNNVTFSSSSASDYRLKKNVTDFNSESWTKVKSVSCRKFDFDAEKFAQAMEDDYTIPRPASYGGRIGFIAHELEAAGIDGAVEGEKDGVDENGVPIYQKVSYTTLVPVLWGALNEAIRKIEILESKVQALEDSS